MPEPHDYEQELTELNSRCDEFSEKLQEHDDLIDGISRWIAMRPGGRWYWASLKGESARELWEKLYEFVEWLRDRYLQNLPNDGFQIPNGWWQHPVAVEMLTALMVAHRSVYRTGKVQASFDLVEWHERCLWPTLQRMKQLTLFPTNTSVSNLYVPPPRITRTPDREDFDAYLNENISD